MSPVPTPTGPGARLGSYELVRLLGEGSMGRVYEARHTKLDRRVALKLLREEQANDPGLVQRFFQEARAVNRIDHRHIVSIHDFVEDKDAHGRPRAYCVMELLEGHTVAELVATGPLPIRRALGIAEQVCDALAAAHAVGVIHRDLKPENVLVSPREDGGDDVKVLDFGVAKLVRPDPQIPLHQTYEGALVGTPRYMAPETAAGLPVDFRADIYGAGCLLYEMLTGRPPFTDETFQSLMASILTQPPAPLGAVTQLGEPVSDALADLVSACLEKAPDRRPDSAGALLTRLHAVEAPGQRKVPKAVTLAAGGVLLCALGLAGTAVLLPEAKAERAPEDRVAAVGVTAAETSAGGPAAPPAFSPWVLPATWLPPPLVEAPTAVTSAVDAAAASVAHPSSKPRPPQGRRGTPAQRAEEPRTSSSIGVSRDAVLDPFAG